MLGQSWRERDSLSGKRKWDHPRFKKDQVGIFIVWQLGRRDEEIEINAFAFYDYFSPHEMERLIPSTD
jgi:hypothetical protein